MDPFRSTGSTRLKGEPDDVSTCVASSMECMVSIWKRLSKGLRRVFEFESRSLRHLRSLPLFLAALIVVALRS